MREDIAANPHGLQHCRSVWERLDRAAEVVRGTTRLATTTEWNADTVPYPVPILAHSLWAAVAPGAAAQGAWHSVARKHGWIPRAQREAAEEAARQKARKGKKKGRRGRGHKGHDAKKKERNFDLDKKIYVSKRHVDKKACGLAMAAAAAHAPHAAAAAAVAAEAADKAAYGGAMFRGLVQGMVASREIVADAQAHLEEEASKHAVAHCARRERIDAVRSALVSERLAPAKARIRRVLDDLRGRWDGLGTVPRLLRGLDVAHTSTRKTEAIFHEPVEPITEQIFVDTTARWKAELEVTEGHVEVACAIYEEEAAAQAARLARDQAAARVQALGRGVLCRRRLRQERAADPAAGGP